ncbi:MAG: NAD-binding protein [Methanothrix sp.]|nr:NAD-binding protein [Methanothrix sp.]MCX8207315.1 NAD-binding protein [Methanothrix sp.]
MDDSIDARSVARAILSAILIVVVHSAIYMVIMRYEGRLELADPVNAVYWVIMTMTTVGYGDIVFRSHVGHIFSIVVSLSGIVLVFAFVLPGLVTPWFEHLGRELPERVPEWLSNHILICGYGPMVERLTERLDEMGMQFAVIESRESVARSIFKKYMTVWGDPSDVQVLRNANISTARMVMVNYTDEINADIVLTVREVSDVEIIAMVEDLRHSRFLSYAGASRVLSPKTMLGTFVAQISTPSCGGCVFPGAVQLFGTLSLAEVPVFPGSPLAGRAISDPMLIHTGAAIAGIWKRGEFTPSPSGSVLLSSGTVILAVGNSEQLMRLRSLGAGDEGRFLVIGYGDVGQRLVRLMCEHGIRPVVVDRRDLATDRFEHVVGDGYSEDALIRAGIKDASCIMIMLNDDHDAIYSTLVARNMNPDAFIIARANHLPSTEKLYRAGADYVASVPMVASKMLLNMVTPESEDLTILYEGLELRRYEVRRRSPMAQRTLRELALIERFGCAVVAIDRAGDAILSLSGETEILPGDVLILIGPPGSVDRFTRDFGDGG